MIDGGKRERDDLESGRGRKRQGLPGVVLPTILLSSRSRPKAFHRSEWRLTLDDAHPFKSEDPITPSFPRSPKAPVPLPPPPQLRQMAALPSFVELMASLGLDNNTKSSPSPAQEFSSPAIVVSSEHEEHISSRIRVARYSPYGAPIVSVATCLRSNRSSRQCAPQAHSHRRSASTLSNDGTDPDIPNRVRCRNVRS